MLTGPFATAVSTIFWTETLVNGTFHVHTERRFAGREHADIIPSPLPDWRERMYGYYGVELLLWHVIIKLYVFTPM